jgi:hypothetical protein
VSATRLKKAQTKIGQIYKRKCGGKKRFVDRWIDGDESCRLRVVATRRTEVVCIVVWQCERKECESVRVRPAELMLGSCFDDRQPASCAAAVPIQLPES